MAQDNKQIASDVLAAVGGKDNVTAATYCMTRLRLNLKDWAIVDDEKVKAVHGVAGVQKTGTQYQVVIGQNVPHVYEYFCAEAGLKMQDAIDENLDAPKEKLTLKKIAGNILDYLSGSMVQLIPLMMAAGLFKCFSAILGPDMLGLISEESNLYILFDFAYDAGFYFMPIYLGYCSAKKIGASPVLGMLMGGILIAPDFQALAGTSFSVFGIPTTAYDYSSTVLPIMLSVAALYLVEKFFKKHIPDTISTIFTPFLTMLVMLPVSLCVLAPLGNYCSYGLNWLINFLDTYLGPIAAAFVGGFWEFIVMTGMHVTIITTMMTVYLEQGYLDGAFICASYATIAVWGVCLGAALRLKDKDEKALTWGYFVSGIIGGVTEPALYGLCFKYKRTFIGLIVGGAAGGLYSSLTGVTTYLMGSSSNILALTGFLGGTTADLVNGLIASAITFVVSAVVTYFTGFTKEELEGQTA